MKYGVLLLFVFISGDLWYISKGLKDPERGDDMSFEEQLAQVNENNAYMRHNHIRGELLTETLARVEAQLSPESLNTMGTAHAGLIMSMAEVCCGMLMRNDGRRYVTLNASFCFLQSNQEQTLVAEATLIRRGRTVGFARACVKDKESGRLLAEGEFTFSCLDSGRS